ncbi:urea abc urea binding protein : Serine/threonine protein kinase OS=Planctomyces brasiliensis (strain ATCC 49424 / DSM 5305 / JCM 21570 / NBRC 103401 / IFAM 1448) GN=Plabr_3021 PE=3 SV=1: Pkinase: Peripla_BP_5 [Gemmataceae bacterium]|nr:urea abc urea binding protein : Serine/threonine protein kinase OS=Planctomyces brasiliensis (strain ATCC 49424 / DSM 5305 / JCM 21570 / NBRC 103401 / IFAM 1448) GN=Plabr_3021 PE=3 SV=1: Pkinase: Peripla_BP_5 [Gemmataceae bacterium]VTT96809.1 urea abc urea binding protein : Serine/threonine protein kinase OS=Planctomyces brasiliensis (strain ATCC 49424 / DSM 5305 / JCM 21570 / NBRC 103401 / IFAM 1448) GN=Plabr_3021 PE=3 SV=1: Pkinase: Peripla_BP_5 [Gemmataceae bacterium]
MAADTPDNTTQIHTPDPSATVRVSPDSSDGFAEGPPPPPDLSFLGPPLEAGDLGQLGTYRVRRVLGVGGMGIVFEAIDSQLRRLVALKVMRPEIAASLAARTRFLKEARSAAALNSDHIVTVFQVGQDNDVPFMAMQLLRGEALDARLAREPRLAVVDAVTIASQAAAGLAAAHDAGLVHRDIKPANLWLELKDEGAKKSADSGRLVVGGAAQHDNSFRVKILDLGLVRGGGGPRLTTAGVVVGTPHFMAPEQAGGTEVDHRADLFSLGCVIHTMLTGELAFPGESTMAVLMALANHTPPPLHELNPAVPLELSQLVAKMMSKSPAGRPPSALQVIEQLAGILDAELERPVAPPPARKPGSGKIGWAEAARRPMVPELKSRQNLPAGAKPADSVAIDFATPNPSPGAVTAPNTSVGPALRRATPPPATPAEPVPAAAPPPHAGSQGVSVGVGLVAIAIALVALGLMLGVGGRFGAAPAPVADAGEPVRIGVIHSKTGSMALSESPVLDATLLAVDEINHAGGVLGRPVQPIVIDGKSDSETFALAAEKLLGEEKVAALFGCWTSASRKAVRPAVERHGSALFYPVQYEGLEQSPRIVYLGATPNQQILPGIDYLTGKLGKRRLFVVGSDYVFPRTAAEVIGDHVKKKPGVEVVGAEFVPLGSREVVGIVEQVRKSSADGVVNLLNGTTNFSFFKELKAAGVTARDVAILSSSIAENELRSLDPDAVAGSHLVASYFQSVDSEASRAFVQKVRAKFGADRVTSDAMAAAYAGVHLWARSANEAGRTDPDAVLTKLRGATFPSPGGQLKVDPVTQHTWQEWRIGRVRADGQVDTIATAAENVAPAPFPATRPRAEWERLLEGLYIEWGSRWQAPAAP